MPVSSSKKYGPSNKPLLSFSTNTNNAIVPVDLHILGSITPNNLIIQNTLGGIAGIDNTGLGTLQGLNITTSDDNTVAGIDVDGNAFFNSISLSGTDGKGNYTFSISESLNELGNDSLVIKKHGKPLISISNDSFSEPLSNEPIVVSKLTITNKITIGSYEIDELLLGKLLALLSNEKLMTLIN